MAGELEESILLELGKVKPITGEEDQSNKAADQYVDYNSSKSYVKEEQKVEKKPSSPSWRRRHPCLACCSVCCLLVLVIVVVIIILAFTLFKVKEPRLHVDNISLDALNFTLPFNIPFSISITATLGFNLSLENPNRASINYLNSTAHMFYRGTEVGLLPIPAGHVGARDTAQISLTIDLMADRLVGSPYILTDLTNGSLPFSTTSRISGRAKILHIFKHHVDTLSLFHIDHMPDLRNVLARCGGRTGGSGEPDVLCPPLTPIYVCGALSAKDHHDVESSRTFSNVGNEPTFLEGGPAMRCDAPSALATSVLAMPILQKLW